jgi:hypothetical protein
MCDMSSMNAIFCTLPTKHKVLEPFADIHPQKNEIYTSSVHSLKSFPEEAFAVASRNSDYLCQVSKSLRIP